MSGYLDWPGVRQVFHLRRARTIGGTTTVEDVYGITSLGPEEAPPAKLLRLIRSHRAIENALHGVRDGSLGEDASRVRKGDAAQIGACLRNLALFLLRGREKRRKRGIADAIRDLRFDPLKAVKLVTT